MPRTGRVVLPGYPHHIVQRGHNRQVVFAEDCDYQYYLDTLRVWKIKYCVRVYAYCLMTNHVHLVLEPSNEPVGLGQLMKRLAGRQTRYVNKQEGRRGTLWEGRYKSSPIQTERYFLACCRYVELNPVRARLVARPEEYRWSSYCAETGRCEAAWLDNHGCYIALGETPHDRYLRYQEFVRCAVPVGEWGLIRNSLQRGQLTGNERFVDEVEQIIGRRIAHRAPGNQPLAKHAK